MTLIRKRLKKAAAVLTLLSMPSWLLAQTTEPAELLLGCAECEDTIHAEIVSWADDERPQKIIFTMPDGDIFEHVVTEEEWSSFQAEDLFQDHEGWTHGVLTRTNGFPGGDRYDYKHRPTQEGNEIEFQPANGVFAPVRVQVVRANWLPVVIGVGALLCLIAQKVAQDGCLESCRSTCGKTSVESCDFSGTCGMNTSCEVKCQEENE